MRQGVTCSNWGMSATWLLHCLIVLGVAGFCVQYLGYVSNMALSWPCLMVFGVAGCCTQYLVYVSNMSLAQHYLMVLSVAGF